MGLLPCVAVARVFALVMRCRDMMLFVYSRVGKNRDTSGGPRQEPGQAVPLTTKLYSLARRFSRYGKAMTYTDLLWAGILFLSVDYSFYISEISVISGMPVCKSIL